MDNLISDSYKQEQFRLHHDDPRARKYGTGGAHWVEVIKAIAAEYDCNTIIDYGCGKGLLAPMLAGLSVQSYDPAMPEFEHLPQLADLVVCLDVLEHIEPDHLSDVLEHMASLARKFIFTTISQKLAGRWLRDGRNSHLIVKNTSWWIDKFEEKGCKIEKFYPPRVTEMVALFRARPT